MALKGNSKFPKYETKNYSTSFSKPTRNDKDMTKIIKNNNSYNKLSDVHKT
jgi:hypothetical protein